MEDDYERHFRESARRFRARHEELDARRRRTSYCVVEEEPPSRPRRPPMARRGRRFTRDAHRGEEETVWERRRRTPPPTPPPSRMTPRRSPSLPQTPPTARPPPTPTTPTGPTAGPGAPATARPPTPATSGPDDLIVISSEEEEEFLAASPSPPSYHYGEWRDEYGQPCSPPTEDSSPPFRYASPTASSPPHTTSPPNGRETPPHDRTQPGTVIEERVFAWHWQEGNVRYGQFHHMVSVRMVMSQSEQMARRSPTEEETGPRVSLPPSPPTPAALEFGPREPWDASRTPQSAMPSPKGPPATDSGTNKADANAATPTGASTPTSARELLGPHGEELAPHPTGPYSPFRPTSERHVSPAPSWERWSPSPSLTGTGWSTESEPEDSALCGFRGPSAAQSWTKSPPPTHPGSPETASPAHPGAPTSTGSVQPESRTPSGRTRPHHGGGVTYVLDETREVWTRSDTDTDGRVPVDQWPPGMADFIRRNTGPQRRRLRVRLSGYQYTVLLRPALPAVVTRIGRRRDRRR